MGTPLDNRHLTSRMVLDSAIARFPRDAFDYMWLINPPAYDVRLTTGMIPIWRDGPDALFRIDHK